MPWRVLLIGVCFGAWFGVANLVGLCVWAEKSAPDTFSVAVGRYRQINTTWSPAKSGVLKPYVAHVARGYESCLNKAIDHDIEALNRLQLTDDYQIVDVSPSGKPSTAGGSAALK
jgi:hypothetical protein